MPRDPEPAATYRLQLGPDRDLDGAAALVPYLAALGVSHLYLSPLFEAVPGSTHGYDVTDPTRVRAELGGRPALDRLRAVLDDHRMGLLLDIVPNHQAAHADNPMWWSLLRDGPEGPAGAVFDVDWRGGPEHPAGTMLLPVLGEPLEEAVASGALRVDTHGGEVVLRHHRQRFPLRPGSAPVGSDPDAMLCSLEQQWYRLADWRTHADEVSHRRFFDVDDLVGVRVEDADVFERTHALVIDLVRSGVVQGLRVDHIDGLADPAGYLERLAAATDGVWVVVEKILEHGERLPPGWLVDGTTGYEVGALISDLLHDPQGASGLEALFAEVTGSDRRWPDEVTRGKQDVLDRLFRPEHRRLTRLATAALGVVDEAAVSDAIGALVVGLDRYRTYPPPSGPMSAAEAGVLLAAADRARATAVDRATCIDELAALLVDGGGDAAGLELRRRYNQATGAVTAKGVEDTALYRWAALPGAGDVGAPPHPLGRSLSEFHAGAERSTSWPGGLVATSTHDSKRSEDARARLAVLGEVGEEWSTVVRRWFGRLAEYPPGEGAPPDALAALVLVQTLVGGWPLDEERAQGHLAKSMREAKLATSWTDPDERYERAVEAMVAAAFGDRALMAEAASFVERLEVPSRVNSLAEVLLKMTLPGIPDLYQGNELWRHDLTDPDNRRPVDFERRRELLDGVRSAGAGSLWPDDGSGRAKLWLCWRALQVRGRHPDAFIGRYAALPVEGEAADHLVAFVRGDQVVTVVPRFPVRLERDGGWRGTTIRLPAGRWADGLDEIDGTDHDGVVAVAELLRSFPVALLVRRPGPAAG
ncbi:MAG: malto-oligosyltrehalose synthase [Acidimicrobiales bacterium]|nr:malto-oligosyltrehalose synthase [Acidimicrobiales bacterium]